MKNIFDITFFAIIQFVFFTIILMILYQGGSLIHPQNDYFTLNENFFSDLAQHNFYNGNKNLFNIFYKVSLTIYGMGIILFFFIISKFCTQKRYLPIIFGALSGLGIIGHSIYWVVHTPESDILIQKFNNFSFIFAGLSFIFFFTATLSLNFFINRNVFPRLTNLLTILNINQLLFLFLLIYIKLYIIEINKIEAIKYSAAIQKILVSIQIITELSILLTLKKINAKINIL